MRGVKRRGIHKCWPQAARNLGEQILEQVCEEGIDAREGSHDEYSFRNLYVGMKN